MYGRCTYKSRGILVKLLPMYGYRYRIVAMNKGEFKRLRMALQKSPQEFGLMLGFKKAGARIRVSEIENGRATISERTLLSLKMIKEIEALRLRLQPKSKPDTK